MFHSDGSILRYKLVQRIGHWVNAVAFLLLLLTGLFLFFSPLSIFAGSTSRVIHRIAAIILFAGPIFYFVADRRDFVHLVQVSFTYNRGDLIWFIRAPLYFLGLGKGLPPQGEVNAGQRLHHALTIIFYNLVGWSGILMWLGVGRIPGQIFLGSLVLHDVSMAVLTTLLVGHVYFTFVYGALNGMIKGTVTLLYARVEHPLWLEQLRKKTDAQ